MLAELSIKEFLEKTAGNEPVPGGGSVSALNAALAAAFDFPAIALAELGNVSERRVAQPIMGLHGLPF